MKISPLKLSMRLFIFWLFLLLFFYLAGNFLFGAENNVTLYSLANWDGRHFLEIAQKGYTNKVQYAFFPLYPLLINFFANFLNINFLYAGLLLNIAAVSGSIYIFLKILLKYGEDATKAILYFLIFPTSFYLICAYSESLFLFFTLLTFFFAVKKNYFLAAFFTSLACLTRITGIAVILSLWVYVFNSKIRLREKIIILLLSLSGFGLYCLYLYTQTGNPFYFLVSEINWGRSLSVPGLSILDSVSYIAVAGLKPESFTIFSDLIFTIFGLGMGIRTIRFLNPPFSVYTIISLSLPLTTILLLSFPRFILIVFPIFMVLSRINNRIFNASYVIISMVLLFLYFNFFLRNIWVS